MRPLVIIPAFNEAATLASVKDSLPADLAVVVIDDGSTDNTGEVASSCGAKVLRHPINRGLGAAIRTGLAYAATQDFDVVITIDADGQHDGADVSRLLQHLETTGADLVIGARAERKHMPWYRRVYNRLASWFTRGLFGGANVDTQSGLRALRLTTARRMRLFSSRMEISSEIVAEAFRLGLRVEQVPITVRYTNYSLSKGQSLGEGVRTAWRLILRTWQI